MFQTSDSFQGKAAIVYSTRTKVFRFFIKQGCFLLLLLACSCAHNIRNPYNQQAVKPGYNSAGKEILKGDIFIVGVEKYKKVDIGWDGKNEYLTDADRNKRPKVSAYDIKRQNARTSELFDDSKELFISHIVEKHGKREARRLYSIYSEKEPSSKTTVSKKNEAVAETMTVDYENAYAKGLASLDILQESLDREFDPNRKVKYTHVFVMAMGWANDQDVSIARFNMIIDSLKNAAGDKAFHPLIIGVTWPSQWWSDGSPIVSKIGHIASIANKENDADAVGIGIMNLLINKHLAKVVPNNVPIVLAGHSFGSRALSRAAYSRDLLKETGSHPVNLIISLQPAYSIHRFIPGAGVEGAPYYGVEPIPHFLTNSRNDGANPFAFWSSFAGGRMGYRRAGYSKYVTRCEWKPLEKTLVVVPPKGSKENAGADFRKIPHHYPVLIEATSIVKDNKGGVSAHNDVLDDEMGQLNYYLLQYAKKP